MVYRQRSLKEWRGSEKMGLSFFIMESINTLNRRLIDFYGIDTLTGKPIYRIVWANDQMEKKRVKTTDAGIELLFPEVVETKKYPYLKDLYVLERLVLVPDVNANEIPVSRQSYEPLWAYRDENQNPLPPIWEATQFIIDTVHAALGKKSLAKYVDSEENTTPEGMDERITKLCDELFGNETDTTDALAHDQAIVVPRNYNKES
jgi:hypothetical protein